MCIHKAVKTSLGGKYPKISNSVSTAKVSINMELRIHSNATFLLDFKFFLGWETRYRNLKDSSGKGFTVGNNL